jgi:hypothetical protein
MSTTTHQAVKIKGQVVEEVDIIQYESVAEAIEAKDEKYVLGLINAQTKTNEMNAARAKHRETEPGKQKMKNLAFNLLPKLTLAGGKSGMDALIECAGDAAALDALLTSDEVVAAVKKSLGEA